LGQTVKVDKKTLVFWAEDAREEKNSQKNLEKLLKIS